jgi:hypothetical protein
MHEHRAAFGDWGEAADHVWRFGYIHGATINVAGRSLSNLLGHPSARFLAELRLWGTGQCKTAFKELVAQLPASLRALTVDIRTTRTADLSVLWPKLGKLARLEITGGKYRTGDLDLPSLTSARLGIGLLDAVVRARWPKLAKLHLALVHGAQRIGTVMPLFERADLPELRQLTLWNLTSANELVSLLGATPVWNQLTELDLAYSELDDAGAKRWAASPPSRRIPVLRIGASRLTHAGAAVLREVAERVERGDRT